MFKYFTILVSSEYFRLNFYSLTLGLNSDQILNISRSLGWVSFWEKLIWCIWELSVYFLRSNRIFFSSTINRQRFIFIKLRIILPYSLIHNLWISSLFHNSLCSFLFLLNFFSSFIQCWFVFWELYWFYSLQFMFSQFILRLIWEIGFCLYRIKMNVLVFWFLDFR